MSESPGVEHADVGIKPTEQHRKQRRPLGKRRGLVSQYPDSIVRLPYDITRKLPRPLANIIEKPIDAVVGFAKGHDLTSGTQTRETKIPGTEIDRGIVMRFQRAEIARAYRVLRNQVRDAEKRGIDAGPQREAVRKFGAKAHVLEKNLDTLNRQFYENVTTVHVEDPELGVHEIPVVTLDLNPPAEGQVDTRIPYFITPSYVTNYHESAAFSMALALAGEKVNVMTYPEKFKMAKSPEDWLDRVKKDGTLKPYAKLAGKIIQGLGLKKLNLIGISMGAGVSLEMASNPNLNIQDLIIIEPPTVIAKNTLKQLFDFVVREGVPATVNAEERAKVVLSESPELAQRAKGTDTVLSPILARRQITQEQLQAINPHGRYQVWFGENSVITGEKTQEEFVRAEAARSDNPDTSPIKMYVIKGGRYGSPVVHAQGVASVITAKQRPQQMITRLDTNSLENSAAAFILNRT